MNMAILLSGGAGIRIHRDVPKQYIRIGGRMLVTYALEPLLDSPFIDAVQIVAVGEWRERILADAEGAGLNTGKITGFAVPGRNRQDSIRNGLKSILCQNGSGADTVLIHDAARPLLKGKLIEECYGALAGHDGVMPVLPMKDTVYLSRDGKRAEELLERSCLYAGQAPELFDLKKYVQANRMLSPAGLMKIRGSAEPAILAGMDIAMIPGDEGNFKVTTEADLQRFRELMGGEKT